MAVTAHFYDNCIANAFGSTSAGNAPNIDILSDSIYVALVTSAYTPNQGTDAFWSTPVTNEATGTGYTANGILQNNKTFAIASHVITFDNTVDPQWTSSTITAHYAVLYDRTPATDATRPLIGYVDFGADVSSSSGNYTITWSGSGIFQITMS